MLAKFGVDAPENKPRKDLENRTISTSFLAFTCCVVVNIDIVSMFDVHYSAHEAVCREARKIVAVPRSYGWCDPSVPPDPITGHLHVIDRDKFASY